MSKITINGVTFETPGPANVTVQVVVNGKIVSSDLSGTVDIKWEGPLAHLNATGNVEVSGNVQGDVDAGGSVKCESVEGDIDAGGSVKITGNVGGSVDAGGSVECGNVGGSVDAGGSVSMRK